MKILALLLPISMVLLGTSAIKSEKEIRLQQLIDHFERKGINIQPHINDERFALVNDITS